MANSTSLIHNILKYSFSSFTSVLLFIIFILAGRYLGVEDFGKFTFALAFVSLFDPLLDPGIYHLLIRNIARNKSATASYLFHALSWKSFASPLAFLLIVVFVNLLHDSPQTINAVYLIALSLILKSFKDPFRSALLAHERFGLEAVSSLVGRLSLLVFGSFVLITRKGLLAICWTFVLVRLCDLLVVALIVRLKVCALILKLDIQFLKRLLMAAIPIGAFYVTINIYNYVDTVMLSVFRGDVEVGLYNASYKIYEGLLIFPGIIGTVFMPRFSKLYNTNLDAFKKLLHNGMKYIIIVAFFVVLNGTFLSDQVIMVFFGISYEKSIVALHILLTGILFVFCINFLQIVFITMNKQNIILYVSMVGLVSNILLNLVLIPGYGYLGAAVATIAVELFVLILLVIFIDKFGHKIGWWKLLLKPVFGLSISVSIFWFLFPWQVPFLRIALVNLCFFCLTIVMGVFDGDELRSASDFLFLRRKSPARR